MNLSFHLDFDGSYSEVDKKKLQLFNRFSLPLISHFLSENSICSLRCCSSAHLFRVNQSSSNVLT